MRTYSGDKTCKVPRRLLSEDLSTLTDEQLMQLSAEDVMGAVANILKGFGMANVA